jgi:PAS domain S-box-containing protein
MRVYIRDISRRRQSEASLKEREMLFRGIYEGSPVGIELYDGEGKLMMANEACLEIFGASESSSIGLPLFDAPNLTEEARQKLRLGQVVRYESKFDFKKVKKAKLYATTKRGQIDIDVVIAPLAFDENKRWGYLVQVQDITSQKKMQRKLKESETLYRTLFKSTGRP